MAAPDAFWRSGIENYTASNRRSRVMALQYYQFRDAAVPLLTFAIECGLGG
jgi:hypothetical protein